MGFDFDRVIPLKGTHSQKFDSIGARTGCTAEDGLPMWVADMDFRPPEAVIDVLQAEIDRGVFGYFGGDGTTRAAIVDWLDRRHGWRIEPGWIGFTAGVVNGLGVAIEAFSDPGDGIVVFTPVYHAFMTKIRAKGRAVVESPMVTRGGRYEMDLDALAAALTGREKMVFFCSPHNPAGRLWSAEEIQALAEFCLAHDLILISDEIHMDLTFPGQTHLPTAVAAPQSLPKLVVMTAASKGFNIAGGETAFVVTPDEALRARMTRAMASHAGPPNRFGMLMLEACFTHGADWSAAVRAYLAQNFTLFRDGVNAIPGLSVMDMPATYLAWVDFAGTGMERVEFSRRVAEDARIGANPGPSFGAGGESFLRFNIATQRARVAQAVARLAAAFGDLQ